jgi:hypothetical protein
LTLLLIYDILLVQLIKEINMPIKDPIKRQEYINKWKKENRLKKGLKKQGRKPYTEEEKIIAKEKKKVYQKEWAKAHPYSTRHPAKRLLWSSKRRSKEEGVPFDLELCDIIIPTHCPYLGLELCTSVPRGQKRSSVISLDKTIPALGYVKGNIEVMSQLANTMKSDATPEQLVTFAKAILTRYE